MTASTVVWTTRSTHVHTSIIGSTQLLSLRFVDVLVALWVFIGCRSESFEKSENENSLGENRDSQKIETFSSKTKSSRAYVEQLWGAGFAMGGRMEGMR